MNAKRLRELLTFAEDNPSLVDITTYGEHRPSGIAADLAGHTLLLSGWTLVADSTFKSPDGSREICRGEAIEAEAQALLGLGEDELWGHSDFDTVFSLPADEAVKRLRELTEEAEAVKVNG